MTIENRLLLKVPEKIIKPKMGISNDGIITKFVYAIVIKFTYTEFLVMLFIGCAQARRRVNDHEASPPSQYPGMSHSS